MYESCFYLIRNVLLLSLLGSTLVGFLHFRKLPDAFKVLTVYALITLVLEVTVIFLADFGKNNLFVMHFRMS